MSLCTRFILSIAAYSYRMSLFMIRKKEQHLHIARINLLTCKHYVRIVSDTNTKIMQSHPSLSDARAFSTLATVYSIPPAHALYTFHSAV